jgi:cellulose synthase/poly-beta-1,6-N-acetylglucosamine synthase-like glycosyltransferase
MVSSTPTIDIVIPACNEAAFLGRCLEAVLAQGYPPEKLAVYVIDHHSKDNTAAIASALGVSVIEGRGNTIGGLRNQGVLAGHGELVVFIDAHCIPAPGWLMALTRCFEAPEVGGAQGKIQFVFNQPSLQRFNEKTGCQSEQHTLKQTLGTHGDPYPWIVTGNCMYRREALEEAGLFDEAVTHAEDLDLAWRVVLKGYQLCYVPQAQVTHYDMSTWGRFYRKYFFYGVGTAEIARIYGLHQTRKPFQALLKPQKGPGTFWLIRLCYTLGFQWQQWQFKHNRGNRMTPYVFAPVPLTRRPMLSWTPQTGLRISPEVIYWDVPWEERAVLVHGGTQKRYLLEGVGYQIWTMLTQGKTQNEVCETLAQEYDAPRSAIEADVTQFITDMGGQMLLVAEINAGSGNSI